MDTIDKSNETTPELLEGSQSLPPCTTLFLMTAVEVYKKDDDQDDFEFLKTAALLHEIPGQSPTHKSSSGMFMLSTSKRMGDLKSLSKAQPLENSIRVSDVDGEYHPIPREDIWPKYPLDTPGLQVTQFSPDLLSRPDIKAQDIQKSGGQLPDFFCPTTLENYGMLSPGNNKYFLKHPAAYVYQPGEKPTLAESFLSELKIWEMLRAQQHPNIATYHGSIVKDGYIRAMVFERYSLTLEAFLKKTVNHSKDQSAVQGAGVMELEHGSSRPKLNPQLCYEGIKSAILHLHSLGFAHNDLNPSNIMLEVDSSTNEATAKLIDCDAVLEIGIKMIKIGDYGYPSPGGPSHSNAENDHFALDQLAMDLGLRQIPSKDQSHSSE